MIGSMLALPACASAIDVLCPPGRAMSKPLGKEEIAIRLNH